MLWFMVVFAWFACGAIAGVIGESKGEGALSFVAGMLLGPIGIIGALASRGNKVQCHACRSWIDPKATICPYCRTEKDPVLLVLESHHHNETQRNIFLGIFVVIALILAIYGFAYRMSY